VAVEGGAGGPRGDMWGGGFFWGGGGGAGGGGGGGGGAPPPPPPRRLSDRDRYSFPSSSCGSGSS
ncbi:hypothetical protein FAS48_26665, partial [Klebsiella pneumoniae subsp. pneumoniae]